ncbi:MAG TPA: signal peptide peptidase SppA, partial [Rhodanobacteraceae bacterium]|nr:signal peptide peptidase SppA [Rhodanobacteraceae bacterium]
VFVRLARGVWNALNFTRLLVFNLIFLILLIAFFLALFSSRPVLRPRTALVLDPRGQIVEQYTIDPVQRAFGNLAGEQPREVQLRDLLRVIDTAAKDTHIERLVLIPDDIAGAGLATLHEIGTALDRFRATGKEVIAVAGDMGQSQYLLAAHANKILLDPDGAVLIEGFASYRSYFKDALDKLGVEVHLIKVGQYKSAAEPYVLNQASDASKEADRYWMGGIWQDYLAEVAGLRKIDAASISEDIAHYDERVAAQQGDLAKLALDQKLVDQLATRADARKLLRDKGVADGDEGFRQVDFKDYLAMLGPDGLAHFGSQVAVVVAQGEIVPGEQPPGMVGGRSAAQLIRSAREDDRVKAVVLRIDSPGGDAYSSELIRREIAQTRSAGKPVVVSMGDVAASGGYWIAMDGDEIWAEPTTITGSIGIFGLVVTIPETLAKIGVHTDGTGTTPLAGTFDIRRPLSPELESILNSVIRHGYSEFIGRVAKARKRTPEEIDGIAQGRVWSGSQAKERGLVDKLGGLGDAIASAAARAKLGKNYQVRYVEHEPSTWERFVLSFGDSETMLRIARSVGFSVPTGWLDRGEIAEISGIVESMRGKPYGAFAHCFCDLR